MSGDDNLVIDECELGGFIREFAHDASNLTSIIKSNADLLPTIVNVDPTSQHVIDSVTNGCRRLQQLIRCLQLRVKNYELPQAPLHLDSDLHSVVEWSAKLMSQIIGPNYQLHTSLRGTPVAVDTNRMYCLIQNLVSNAIDAMPQGGQIDLFCYDTVVDALLHYPQQVVPAGSYTVLEVADNGPGIADSIAATLFRQGISTKGNVRGRGLYTVKHIADSHNGIVVAESVEDMGTTVLIYFSEQPQNL